MVFCATPFFLLFSFFINYQINCHNYTKLIGSTIKLCVRDLVRCSASIVYILEMRKKKNKTVCKWGLKLTATGNFSIWLKEKIKAGTKTKHKYFPSLIITSGLLAKPVLQALASSVFSCLDEIGGHSMKTLSYWVVSAFIVLMLFTSWVSAPDFCCIGLGISLGLQT